MDDAKRATENLRYEDINDVNVDRLIEHLAQASQRVQGIVRQTQKAYGDRNSILLLGPSRSGKSTIASALSGTSLHRGIVDGDFTLTGHQRIGHGAPVGTHYPESIPIASGSGDLLLWDCPGFGDGRGPFADVVNHLAIFRVLESFRNVKIVLVLSEPTIFNVPISVTKLLNEVTSVFTDLTQLQNMTSLIITKRTPRIPTARLRQYVQDGDNALTRPSRRLLEFLVTNAATRIADFPEPLNDGIYEYPLTGIWSALEATAFQQPRHRVVMPPGANHCLALLAQRLNGGIRDDLQREMAAVQKDAITYLRNGPDASTIRRNLHSRVVFMQALLRTPNAPSFAAIEGLSNEGRRSISAQIDQLRTLRETTAIEDNPIDYNVSAWHAALVPTISRLMLLAKLPVRACTAGCLTLSGYFIASSDVVANLADDVKSINVFSLNTWLVDQDITSYGSVMSVFAPYWKVSGPRRFNLRGKPGQYVPPGAIHGQPGGCGGNGGSFYGVGSTFTDSQLLTIDVSGGRGANGSKGTDGLNGVSGTHGNLAHFTRGPRVLQWDDFGNYPVHGPPHRKDHSPMYRTLWNHIGPQKAQHQIHIAYTPVTYDARGTPGTQGHSGGRGGAGGFGGYAGTITIVGIPTAGPHPATIITPGEVGVNGAHGIGGAGGAHGSHVRGSGWEDIVVWDDVYRNSQAVPPHTIPGVLVFENAHHVAPDPPCAPPGATPSDLVPADPCPRQVPIDVGPERLAYERFKAVEITDAEGRCLVEQVG